MRDFVMFGIVFGAVPAMIMHPWVGAILWAWVSLMNPHRLAWTWAYDFPFAAVVAGATLLGAFLSKDERKLPVNALVIALIVLVCWMAFTTIFAIELTLAWEMFKRVIKIQLMVLVTIAVLRNIRQLRLFIWIVVLSIGFYGLKGGAFTILTGGSFRVWGPPGSFIEGNNELALAIIMIIPLMRYLYTVEQRRWVRFGLLGGMILSALAALGSQSRGALLAIVAMAVFMWVRTSRKFMSGLVLALMGIALVAFMPQSWEARMQSIQEYQQDGSAMGRINAWMMAYNLAKDRPIGGGFEVTSKETFARYAPNPSDVHVAHSIYFQVLGEHGFPGLLLFLVFWAMAWRSASRLRARARASPETKWAGELAGMVQVALVGYFVGGAFLSLAYFDLPYDLVAMIIVAETIIGSKQAAPSPAGSSMRAHPIAPPPRAVEHSSR